MAPLLAYLIPMDETNTTFYKPYHIQVNFTQNFYLPSSRDVRTSICYRCSTNFVDAATKISPMRLLINR